MTAPSPRSLGLPVASWRPGQAAAIANAVTSQSPVIAIDAPTGVGKSIIALGIARLVPQKSVILTETLGLQDQYRAAGVPGVEDIRGMSRYPCVAAQDQWTALFKGREVGCDQGPCHTGERCVRKLEGGCRFYDQLSAAAMASCTVTSYAFWLSGDPTRLGVRGLLALDEAHHAAEAVKDAMSFEVSERVVGSPIPRAEDSAEVWRGWASRVEREVKIRKELAKGHGHRLRLIRALEAVQQIQGIDSTTWAWEAGSRTWGQRGEGFVRFAPLSARPFVQTLRRDAQKLVLLSATLTRTTLDQLGIAASEVQWIRLPSPFPADRRKVWVLKQAGRLDSRSGIPPGWLSTIDEVLATRPDRKGLLHTVSYARAQYLHAHSLYRDRFLVPRSSRELPAMLQRFRALPPESGAVLVSPAIGTGFDFPYEDAEFQIIAKVPFPDTRSPIMHAQLHQDPGLRDHITLVALIQMAGRAMRARDDRGETFITDAHAVWFLKRHLRELPPWFVEAITLTSEVPDAPPPLREETA